MDINDCCKYKNLDLEKKILGNRHGIEIWFRNQWLKHKAPFYSSVDIRNAGYKISPIDLNLFPGGFNNINHQFFPLASFSFQNAIQKLKIPINNILIIPENHTRNSFYLENIYILKTILEAANFIVRIGTINEEITENISLKTFSGNQILLEPIAKKDDYIVLADGTIPSIIVLNNDLSVGIPNILKNIKQKIIPPTNAGWHLRRKTNFFKAFDKVMEEFTEIFNIDSWFINPYFRTCKNLDFTNGEGQECLAHNANILLKQITEKYKEYHINEKPFVIVKADAGTYGMGIMTITDAEQLLKLNRKNKNKMSTIKEGQSVTEAIVQEGVYTYETIQNKIAEPVIYMVDNYVIGGFYRTHDGRKNNENLNASGMTFIPLENLIPNINDKEFLEYEKNRHFTSWDGLPIITDEPKKQNNRFYTYGVIARLALLAASFELNI